MASDDVASRVRAVMENMHANAESADKQASACATIACMAGASADSRATVGSVAGVFDVIVGAMRRHEGVATVQEQACQALRYLAWNDANCSAIGGVAGVFDAIVGAMRRYEGVAEVQVSGCLALASLAHNNDANRSAIGSVAGVFDAIVGGMRRHEGVANVQQQGCCALGNLARNNDANRCAIGNVVGVFGAIVGGMRRHEGVSKVQRWACRALCQLVTCSAATATSGGFLAGLFGWLKSSTEASAEVATAERNATRLAAVAGVKEVLQASRHGHHAARVLEAMKRAEVALRRAATAERRIADAERRASEASKRAEDEAKRANEEAKRANDESKRADIAERRAVRAEAPPGPTPATARLAMVIANAEYQYDEPPLPRCADDGEAMEDVLRARGFTVTRHNNLVSDAMELAVLAFRLQVRANPGCIAVLYFTGHGFDEENGDLFLVPVNGAVGAGGVPLSLRRVEQAVHEDIAGQESTIVIILDCCRVNDNIGTYKGRNGPRWTHASKGGGPLHNQRYLSQYLVAYACESGTAAHAGAEGAGLSPFTDALVPPLREGVPLDVALQRATTVVFRQTQRTQRPCYRSSLGLDEDTAPLVL